jgi:AcrR family transcriptional regulator
VERAVNALPDKSAARGQRQRDRILSAAQRCFITHGFHAASMANIADTAGMSAGLIYRYFGGKADIILAIIARQLEDSRASIAALQGEPDHRRRIVELFEGWRAHDPAVPNAALFLEMTAQASRDPRIAQAIEDADRISGDDFTAWLRQRARAAGAQADEHELRARALALKAFIDGLRVRALRAPHTDVAVIESALDRFLPTVLDFG